MLLFCDSFDRQSNTDLGMRWSNGGFAITASGRNGTNGITHSGSSATETISKVLPGSYSELIVGFAFQVTSVGSRIVMQFREGGTAHVDLRFDGLNRIQVTRNGTVLATGTTQLPVNTYNYIEIKANIHDSTGWVEVRVNGVEEINITGQDTRNGGTGLIDIILLWGQGSQVNYFDDFYVCDTVDSGVSGAPNNDFLGDIRVQALLPNANGTTSNLVGNDGNSTDNYLLVDEVNSDSDTTYVESGTVSDKDTYGFESLTPTSGTVYGVQICTHARKTDAGVRSIKMVSRESGGTEEDSAADIALTTTFLPYTEMREAMPSGTQWTIADVNAAEFGVKVTA